MPLSEFQLTWAKIRLFAISSIAGRRNFSSEAAQNLLEQIKSNEENGPLRTFQEAEIQQRGDYALRRIEKAYYQATSSYEELGSIAYFFVYLPYVFESVEQRLHVARDSTDLISRKGSAETVVEDPVLTAINEEGIRRGIFTTEGLSSRRTKALSW